MSALAVSNLARRMSVADSFDCEELLRCLSTGGTNCADSGHWPPPMLMVDRITHISSDTGAHGRGEVRAELDLEPELWFLGCHFPRDPVMPGCLGLDALWQLTAFFLAWSGHTGHARALGVGEARLLRGLVLADTHLVTYRLDIKRVFRDGLVMCLADGTLAADGREIYTAKDLRVGLLHGGEATA